MLRSKVLPLFLSVFMCMLLVELAAAERFALVVGNSEYQHVTSLTNPANDALDVSVTLENLGFQVSRVVDGTRGEMEKAIDDFRQNVSMAEAGAALFYYAGHGVQHDGVNYLIPVNADINNRYELLDEGVSVDRVMDAMNGARADFNMVVLDACRDNPFFSSRSMGSRGLAVVGGGGQGSLVAFATSPGDTAADGGKGQRNSPYTKAFLKHATSPGLEISTLMRRVHSSVLELTGEQQKPWFNASYDGDFYLVEPEAQLAESGQKAQKLNSELEKLEEEIARREAAIAAAANKEEKVRLQAEQQRARAEEEAKRLQAEQLKELEEAARRALEQRKANEQLREEMENELASRRAALEKEAGQRRERLAALQAQAGTQADVWVKLTTIAQINNAIGDINRRFDQTVDTTVQELKKLLENKLSALRENNPMDPWETKEEWRARLAEKEQELRDEYEDDRRSRKAELERNRRKELSPLQEQLLNERMELNGTHFSIGAGATKVVVEDFNANEKAFPIEVKSTKEKIPFVSHLEYRITSRDREVLREEYYRVFSADKAGGLSGEFNYTVLEIVPDIWAVVPTQVKVINLLEDDAELVSGERGKEVLVSTSGAAVEPQIIWGMRGIENTGSAEGLSISDGGAAQTAQLREGKGQAFLVAEAQEQLGGHTISWKSPQGDTRARRVNISRGLNLPLSFTDEGRMLPTDGLLVATGLHKDSAFYYNGRRVVHNNGAVMLPVSETAAPDGYVDVNVESPWIKERISRRVNVAGAESGTVWLHLAKATEPKFGGLDLEIDSAFSVYDSSGRIVESGSEGYIDKGDPPIKLKPGEYQLALRKPDDPYIAQVEKFTVRSGHAVQLGGSNVPYSPRYHIDESRARIGSIDKKLGKRKTRDISGWSILAGGLAGIAGGIYSYIEAQNIQSDYDSTNISTELSDLRSQAETMGIVFTASTSVGVISTGIGSVLAFGGSSRGNLLNEKRELEQRINKLSAEVARQKAENSLLGMEVSQ